jgi:hypothetical protein
MKKHLMIFVVALLAVAIAVPALAAVEFKYGGQFRVRFENQDNAYDGTNLSGFYGSGYNSDDNRRFIDQRLRLYFSFIASKNLKVVVKWEMGDAVWGMSANTGSSVGNTGANAGANVGADAVSVEVKNAYIEFNIPNTPSTAIVGVQSINILDSWILDDDFAAAVLVTKLDPFKITLGYVGGQYGWERKFDPNELPLTNENYNVDTVVAVVDFAEGPFKASLVGLFQDAHSSDVSINPASLATPVRSYTGISGTTDATAFPFTSGLAPRNNYLFDLGFNATYKTDWLLAYVNFVKNFGSADLYDSITGTLPGKPNGPQFTSSKVTSVDYTGFMIDAGATYFCGPWTVNIGGFYTSGSDINKIPELNGSGTNVNGIPQNLGGVDANTPFKGISSKDVNWFTYPLSTAKYFSEIIGGGVLGDDIYAVRGYNNGIKGSSVGGTGDSSYWRGYGFPTNLWTVTIGGSYQLAETTKVSASYWYFGTASSVPVAFDLNGNYKMSSSIGHELDFYLDQGIVDGLTLTLVGAYLIADDAFCPLPVPTATGATSLDNMRNNPIYFTPHADDAWELGARLQWNF